MERFFFLALGLVPGVSLVIYLFYKMAPGLMIRESRKQFDMEETLQQLQNSIFLMIVFVALISFPLLMSCGLSGNKNESNKSLKTVELIDKHPGEIMYKRHCLACHQRDASGIPGMYPPLANNKVISGDKVELIGIVLNGMSGEIEVNGEVYNGIMASYRNLPDKEIADVLNYLRSGFGNSADSVTPEDVKGLR
ncbi:MAG: cytochrome c [Marinilabiliaceae bacterium]|nr:cytochrome c [Marinilabiliaceae bacterium]